MFCSVAVLILRSMNILNLKQKATKLRHRMEVNRMDTLIKWSRMLDKK